MIFSQRQSNELEFVGFIGDDAITPRLGDVTSHLEKKTKAAGTDHPFFREDHLSLIFAWFECGGRSGNMSVASHID